MKLTKLEKKILNAMRNNEYNDALEDGYTWSFTVVDNSGLKEKQAGGVITSLIEKGLVVFQKAESSSEEDTLGFTEEGEKLFDKADGKPCGWGGPNLLKEEEDKEEKKMDTKKLDKEAKRLAKTGMEEVLKVKAPMTRMTVQEMEVSDNGEVTMVKFLFEEKEYRVAIEGEEVVAEEVKKEEPEEKKGDTVILKAFTGMYIGEFKIKKESKRFLWIETKDRDLRFDKETGIQLNSKNPKYANRIERA